MSQSKGAVEFQIRIAIGFAMNSGRPFSWVKSRDVQVGVWLEWTQNIFAKAYMGNLK